MLHCICIKHFLKEGTEQSELSKDAFRTAFLEFLKMLLFNVNSATSLKNFRLVKLFSDQHKRADISG